MSSGFPSVFFLVFLISVDYLRFCLPAFFTTQDRVCYHYGITIANLVIDILFFRDSFSIFYGFCFKLEDNHIFNVVFTIDYNSHLNFAGDTPGLLQENKNLTYKRSNDNEHSW